MRTNTNLLKQSLAVNHVDLDTGDTGKHMFMQVPINPGPTLPGNANEGLIYTKSGVNTDIYYSPDAGSKEYQLTRTDDTAFAKFGTNTNYVVGPPSLSGGWTFLPGGLFFQYGSITTPGGSTGTVTFPIAFTNPPFSITIGIGRPSGSSSSQNFYVDTITASQFDYSNTSSNNDPIYWMAIGK